MRISNLFLFIIYFFIVGSLFAQSTSPAFKLGLCFMPQTTFMPNKGEEAEPNLYPQWRPGFMTGITSGVVFEKVNLDFGILYSMQGITYAKSTPFYAPATLHYIKVPVTLTFHPLQKFDVPLSLTGGFQLSNLVSATIDMPSGWSLGGGKDAQWFNKNILDVVAGIGFDFALSNNLYLNLKGRIDYSLGDPVAKDYIYNKGGNRIMHWKADRSATRNITLGLLVGIEYYFHKK